MASILCHTNISEVASKYPPKPVTNLQLIPGKLSIALTWEDQADYTEEGYTCTWDKTVVVRKTGGYPNDIHDGTVVVTIVERDKHKTNPYIDSNLTVGTTYYYRVFTCSSDGIYGEPTGGFSVPIQYKVMTVVINLNNSNPETCGSYADDATTMSSGLNSADWKTFFGYRPCIMSNGSVVAYLNENNFAVDENGNSVNISSGSPNDVMIEFPRRGIKISKSGKVVTVSMTDAPNDPDFKYYAHQRGSVNKDYFYLGAYDASKQYNSGMYMIRSVTGMLTCSGMSISDMVEGASLNGSGYGCIGYYQWLYVQVMYVLQFRGNLDSQRAVGYGNSNSGDELQTGRSNTKGMNYADNTVVKLFGLEDIWGNVYQFVNNFAVSNSGHIMTTTDDTITDTSKYNDVYTYGYSNETYGFASECIGNSELGFYPIYESNHVGSTYTYFCDFYSFNKYDGLVVGCHYNGSANGGLFYFASVNRYSGSSQWGTRLQYL